MKNMKHNKNQKTRTRKTGAVAALPVLISLAAVSAGPMTAAAQAQGINVTVNGDAVAFAGQQPVQRFGTVLVPLRGVFERLGANVQYESATKTIVAIKGPTTVSLRLGASQAFVNGETRSLSTPAQAVAGTTLVPLRFVSEALGAQVKWEANIRTVRIATDAMMADNLPTNGGGGMAVTGTITGIFPETNTVTVRVAGGQNTQIPLAPDAVVLVRGAQNSAATTTSLSALRAGDQITVRRDEGGRGTILEARYGERRGEVKSVQQVPSTGNYLVTLTNGATVEMAGDAPVEMAGRRAAITDIKPGEKVVIRVNPQTRLGTGLAVATGGQIDPTPPSAVEVSSLTHSAANRALRSGETVTVTLRGTPGAQASFSVPGLPNGANRPMNETAPGVYTGTFTVPGNLNLKGATLLASLKRGGTTSPVLQAAERLNVDSAGPALGSLSPAEGTASAEMRPLLYGTFTDAGSGLDPRNTKLLVNGQDVTGKTTITDAFFSFRPDADLPTGRNTAVIVARDAAGNETRREWAFSVTPAATIIKTVAVTPSGKTLEPGEVVTVRVEAAPGSTAHFDIGGAVTNRPLRETAPGVYTGSYTVKRGDSLAKAPVTVSFKTASGQVVTQTAPQSLTIAAGAPSAPVIESPQAGAATGQSVTFAGRAAPNSTVRVTIGYQGRLLILPAAGTIGTVEAKTDANGRWKTEALSLEPPLGVSNLQYTAQAVTVGAGGEVSDMATLKFKR